MKKLTAGILASLIGLVSANSADAAVASKAYVDGAIETLDAAKVGTDEVTSFVKTVSETDGKISATAGDLADVIVSGENVTVKKNEITGQLVIDGHAADGNTQYTFTNGEGVAFTTSTDAAGNVTVSADAVLEAGSKNVTIGTSADGKKVTIAVAEQDIASYTFNDTTTVNLEKVEGEDGNFTVTATGLYTGGTNVTVEGNVISAKDTTLNDYTVEGDTGLQVLTRSCTGEGEARTCSYMWETIDRDYDATKLDVPHDE